MIQIIYGAKGSGKTKKMIDEASICVEKTLGNVVFLTDTNRYMFDIASAVRVVNTSDHHINTIEGLLGFIKGLIAGDHDIKEIFIDGAHRMVGKDVKDMEEFFEEIEIISKNFDLDFVIAVSKDKKDLPDFIKKLL